MKKIIIGIVVVLVLVLGVLVFYRKTDSIKLKTNGGVPYNWEYLIENSEIVKFKAKKTKVKHKNLPGGEIIETYIFKGVKKGTTTIEFKYKSITSDEVTSVKKYTATVDKNLNLKIVEAKF